MAWRLLTVTALALLAGAPFVHALPLDPADWTTSDGGVTWMRPYNLATENHQSYCARPSDVPTAFTYSCIPWPAGAQTVVVEARDVSGASVRVFADFFDAWRTDAPSDFNTGCSSVGEPATLSTRALPTRFVTEVDVYAHIGRETGDCLPAVEGVLIVSFSDAE